MSEERFVTFEDTIGTAHTVRIVDIQAVGVNRNPLEGKASYIRAHNYAAPVSADEAEYVRSIWMREG